MSSVIKINTTNEFNNILNSKKYKKEENNKIILCETLFNSNHYDTLNLNNAKNLTLLSKNKEILVNNITLNDCENIELKDINLNNKLKIINSNNIEINNLKFNECFTFLCNTNMINIKKAKLNKSQLKLRNCNDVYINDLELFNNSFNIHDCKDLYINKYYKMTTKQDYKDTISSCENVFIKKLDIFSLSKDTGEFVISSSNNINFKNINCKSSGFVKIIKDSRKGPTQNISVEDLDMENGYFILHNKDKELNNLRFKNINVKNMKNYIKGFDDFEDLKVDGFNKLILDNI